MHLLRLDTRMFKKIELVDKSWGNLKYNYRFHYLIWKIKEKKNQKHEA